MDFQASSLIPNLDAEFSLAEELLLSSNRQDIESAITHFDGLSRDGYDHPQLLSLRLAQANYALGRFRKAEDYLSQCLLLPLDDEGDIDASAHQLKRQLNERVANEGQQMFAMVFSIIGISIVLAKKWMSTTTNSK